jgi:3-dehydroquinate synthase
MPDERAAINALQEAYTRLKELGWREAVVVGAAVILTLAVTLFASWAMGFTINRVSLFALIFSIGILVDDAIVVVENIVRHQRLPSSQGKSLHQIAVEAVSEVGNPTVLATLPERLRIEGAAEIVKAALLADPLLLARLERDPGGVRAGDPELTRMLVLRAAGIKAEVVAGDEREAGARAHLNLGHTHGHALETLTGYGTYLHGEAVSVGLIVALELGADLGVTPRPLVDRVRALLAALGLPTAVPRLERAALHATLARDKKARDGVRFVLLEDVGRPVLRGVTAAELDAVLDRLGG